MFPLAAIIPSTPVHLDVQWLRLVTLLPMACVVGAGVVSAADSIDTYALPAKTAFPAAMPRYPNAWFYIDASLAPSFEAAVPAPSTC